jgi:hypothetical protein
LSSGWSQEVEVDRASLFLNRRAPYGVRRQGCRNDILAQLLICGRISADNKAEITADSS